MEPEKNREPRMMAMNSSNLFFSQHTLVCKKCCGQDANLLGIARTICEEESSR